MVAQDDDIWLVLFLHVGENAAPKGNAVPSQSLGDELTYFSRCGPGAVNGAALHPAQCHWLGFYGIPLLQSVPAGVPRSPVGSSRIEILSHFVRGA